MSLVSHFSIFPLSSHFYIYTLSLHDALPILPLTCALHPICSPPREARRTSERKGPDRRLPRRSGDQGEWSRPLGHPDPRSEEHTSELQSQSNLVCRLLLEKKKKIIN